MKGKVIGTDGAIGNADNTPKTSVSVLGKKTDIRAADTIMEIVKHAVSEVVKHKVMSYGAMSAANRKDVISAAEITAEAIAKGMTFMINGQK
ncbi:hypothetical protein [Xenorhabdus bovienii]|uniref:Uncharacterized protein n=2 Tax=Xenorhabdus bovienii TaxID=40576 RepID=A0A077NE33_XENBV|nr:hypothetical protein [Xenorhabdus bovienii]CDG96155.1 hypothetical protein XBP1_1940016 [Xenorhabdus bovienii str. puntauvense]CDH00765.1 hypothetical protein XBFM1_1790006 [Xenorhabdus bovienii str. feltiae Moldova]